MTNCNWLPPPVDLSLSPTEVHVWRISLKQPVAVIQQCRQTLSGDELSRAKRFHFERDRQRFIVARSGLRQIISRYTKQQPTELYFGYTDYGKPFLSHPAESGLRFNLSHSGDLALYALAYERDLGLDIEQIRPMADALQIAGRFFSAPENEALQTVPPEQRDEAFFNGWTRKEAYIKAIGEGLSHPLDSFDVSLKPGETAQLLAVRSAPADRTRWSLRSLVPASGYVAALVVEGAGWQLRCWRGLP